MITIEDIYIARERIRKYIYHTPLEISTSLSKKEQNIYLKIESQQKLKGFKIRGALSKMTMLTEEERVKGVIACSSGNHGVGVSFGAQILGNLKAKIFVPGSIPEAKLEKIQYYGAEVVKCGTCYDDAHRAVNQAIETEGMVFIDPCSDEAVIAGQGSIALEILESNPDIDTILVPIGGGGMITGVSLAAKALKPSIQIIGLQTAACPAMVRALEDDCFYEEYPNQESICDALVGGVGEIPFQLAKECIDDIIIVQEKYIAKAIKHLIFQEKIIAEPSGAIGVGAILQGDYKLEGKNIAIIISGGNIDRALLMNSIKEV